MNISNSQSSHASETQTLYSAETIYRELSLLYDFAEGSLINYQAELFQYLVPVLTGAIAYLLSKHPGDIKNISKLYKRYSVYHYACHKNIMDVLRNDIDKAGSQQPLNSKRLTNMTVTMRKATRKLLTNFLISHGLQFILDIENQNIKLRIVDDSVDEVEFVRSQFTQYVDFKDKLTSTFLERSVDHPKDIPISTKQPSIAVASFVSRLDAHIICIRISPDGKNFAASTENGLVHLWTQTADNKIAHHLLLGHTEKVVDMDFSRDGNYLITGGLDGSLKLWLTQEGRCLVNYRTYSSPIWFVRFNPTNRVIIVVYSSCLLQFFNTDDIQEAYHFSFNWRGLTAVAWSKQSNYFIGTVEGDVFMLVDRSNHRYLMGFGMAVTDICPMDRMDYLLVGYESGELAVFNLLDNQRLTIIKAHEKPVRKILYNSLTRHITTLAEDGHVKMWELRVIDQESTKVDSLQSFSFHEAQQQQKKSKSIFSFFLVHDYVIEGMEFIEGVILKEDVMVVAGVENDVKLNSFVSLKTTS